MFIKKGDTVKVISGNSKGRTGKIIHIFSKAGKVVVEGVNIVSRHTKPSNSNPDGGIIKREAPIAISNVQLVDTKKDNIASKVGKKIVDGKKVRYFKKTGNVLDK